MGRKEKKPPPPSAVKTRGGNTVGAPGLLPRGTETPHHAPHPRPPPQRGGQCALAAGLKLLPAQVFHLVLAPATFSILRNPLGFRAVLALQPATPPTA